MGARQNAATARELRKRGSLRRTFGASAPLFVDARIELVLLGSSYRALRRWTCRRTKKPVCRIDDGRAKRGAVVGE